MAFVYHCKECPMKFQTETDLQTHQIVHSDTPYIDPEPPAMTEFLRSLFHIGPSDIPPLKHPNSTPNGISIQEPPDDECINKTYTPLANMHVPGMVVPSLDDLIKIVPIKKKIRYLQPVRFARPTLIQPVYIERPRRSLALIQTTYGDDRCSRAVLRPEVVMSRVTPTITRVQRLDDSRGPMSKIEMLKRQVLARTPKALSPPPTKTQESNTAPPDEADPKPPTANNNLYSCLLCQRRFPFSFQLNRHLMMVHSRGREHPQEGRGGKKRGRAGYACIVCKRSFGRINYLNLHKRIHERSEQDFVPTTEVLGT